MKRVLLKTLLKWTVRKVWFYCVSYQNAHRNTLCSRGTKKPASIIIILAFTQWHMNAAVMVARMEPSHPHWSPTAATEYPVQQKQKLTMNLPYVTINLWSHPAGDSKLNTSDSFCIGGGSNLSLLVFMPVMSMLLHVSTNYKHYKIVISLDQRSNNKYWIWFSRKGIVYMIWYYCSLAKVRKIQNCSLHFVKASSDIFLLYFITQFCELLAQNLANMSKESLESRL
jgi:hypothetical protein